MIHERCTNIVSTRDGRKVEDDILSHGRFQVSINGEENKEEGKNDNESEERREMAPGCSTKRRPVDVSRARERLLHNRLGLQGLAIFHRHFPRPGEVIA